MRCGINSIKLAVYADDITVVIGHEADVMFLKDSLKTYEQASSARLNWDKTESLWCGQSGNSSLPLLPGGVKWGRRGLKFLGVWLGTEEVEEIGRAHV